MLLSLLLLVFIPVSSWPSRGSRPDLGNSTFYNFDTVRGSRQSVGSTDFNTFSDGSNTTRSRIGSIDIYSGSDLSVSGSTN